jgi:hypothetical protein
MVTSGLAVLAVEMTAQSQHAVRKSRAGGRAWSAIQISPVLPTSRGSRARRASRPQCRYSTSAANTKSHGAPATAATGSLQWQVATSRGMWLCRALVREGQRALRLVGRWPARARRRVRPPCSATPTHSRARAPVTRPVRPRQRRGRAPPRKARVWPSRAVLARLLRSSARRRPSRHREDGRCRCGRWRGRSSCAPRRRRPREPGARRYRSSFGRCSRPGLL